MEQKLCLRYFLAQIEVLTAKECKVTEQKNQIETFKYVDVCSCTERV